METEHIVKDQPSVHSIEAAFPRTLSGWHQLTLAVPDLCVRGGWRLAI